MITTPDWLRPQICTVYPPNNTIEFERWFGENYGGDVSDREYLPIYFCAYHVNNNYGNDANAQGKLRQWISDNVSGRKVFVISQYDDGTMIDWESYGVDCLEFNMSKTGDNKFPIPLLAQPHPYTFSGEKKYLASFIGSHTHPIREEVFALKGTEGFYISDEPHTPEEYCRVLSQSHFGLCPRGYGLNSFRIMECLQYGATPIYISDEFIEPYKENFNSYGLKISPNFGDMKLLLEDIHGMPFLYDLSKIYNEYFTYKGCKRKITDYLLSELS
jgi:hypothetical protein